MEYIRVTKENLEKEHICCAISNNKDIQVSSKKLRRSRINRVMKIGVNDKKSVGSVKANMVVRINVIVSSF